MNPYTAQRLFDRASREAYARNGHVCECENTITVLVKTRRRGTRRVDLGAHGAKHLSSCQHSEMARTCWDGLAPPRISKMLKGRMKARLDAMERRKATKREAA